MRAHYPYLVALFISTTLLQGDNDLKHISNLIKNKKNIIPVAIIGSGPAGLSAAIPPARSGYYTVIFQGPKPLGELSEAYIVENWPGVAKASGEITMQKLEDQVRQFGVQLVPLLVTEVDFKQWPFTLYLNDGTQVHALTVICATGSSQQKLGIEGEDTYWGRGLFSCGLCDGSYAHDKDTVVIGSGDIAIQRVLQLAPEANKVTLIAPDARLKAQKTMRKKIQNLPNVSILFNKELKEIRGNDNQITHLILYDSMTKETTTFPTSSVFLSTGLTPNTDLFKGVLPIDANGCLTLIKDSRSQQTPIDGIMAAGTVSDSTYPQVAAIVGDGTKAGMDALMWLSKWSFDGPLRYLLSQNLYSPPKIPHPHITKLTTMKAFRKAIKSTDPVLVEFFSPTCPSCKKMEGPLAAITEYFKDVLKVYKVERDTLYALIEEYDIEFMPAFLLFKNGEVIKRHEGETSIDTLKDFIASSLAIKDLQMRVIQ